MSLTLNSQLRAKFAKRREATCDILIFARAGAPSPLGHSNLSLSRTFKLVSAQSRSIKIATMMTTEYAPVLFATLIATGLAHSFPSFPSRLTTAPIASPSLTLTRVHAPLQISTALPMTATSNSVGSTSFDKLRPIEVRRPDTAMAVPSVKGGEEEGDEDNFDWFKSWYPVVPVEYLDPEKPHAFKLLGMNLVVWNDGPIEGGKFGPKKDRPKNVKRLPGMWRAFTDACPHRKVPLSEGRVEDDGTLLCSYHAWRFDGDGRVKSVPQARPDLNEMDKIRANPKSSCNAFPVKVVGGLLWVWAGSGPDALLESELTAVPMMPLPHQEDGGKESVRGVEEERVKTLPWNFRHLPYGHDYFLENVVDPAHVPASHHNIVGNRYTSTRPMNITTSEPVTKHGFGIHVEQVGGDDGSTSSSTTKFTAPCLVQIYSPTAGGGDQILELYSSPSTPGFCNHIGRQVIVTPPKMDIDGGGKAPRRGVGGLKQFAVPMPKWLLHVLSGTFLNQDALFLHTQERTLHDFGEYSTAIAKDEDAYNYNDVVLPTSADKGVINFRNWLRRKAGGRIPYRNLPVMPAPSNDVVFDTYDSHTRRCRYCTDALRRLRKTRYAAYLAAALIAIIRPPGLGLVGSTAVAGAFSGIGLGTNKLMKLMHKMEFAHSDND